MPENRNVTIIGGGNGAFAAAAHLTLSGLQAALCDPYNDGESLLPLLADRKLGYTGCLGEGTVTLNNATPRLDEAVQGSGMILVCVPSTAHAVMAKWLAPLISSGTTILLDPGHTGGALNFTHALRQNGFQGDLTLGETNTLTYIARKNNPASVHITNVAKNVYISALPGSRLDDLLEKTSLCYPELRPCKTVIGTSLRNLNSMMHPPGMILSAAWIEATGGDFTFYYDAATPGVEHLMERIDQERMRIGEKWGEKLEPLMDMLIDIGTTPASVKESGSLQKAFKESAPNRWIKAPPSLDHRYMHEDFGYGLAPMVSLAGAAGVDVPVMRSLVAIASAINQTDYLTAGLSLEKMGLAGLSFDEIKRFLAGT